ncbi:MAG: methyltransferase domain-containing protein [Tepidisphaeraceae bacterium]
MTIRAPDIFLATRRREAEWMDAPEADPVLLERSLRFIRRVNRLFGYTRATLWHLERFSRRWKPGETIRLIDFATGSGDVPLAIARWATKRGLDVEIIGVDLHERTCDAARAATRHEPRIRIVHSDVLALPFEAGSFDYALSSMFLHHLDDEQIVAVLRAMDRVARRGILAADLLRRRRAYAWISLFTLFSNPMLRHDARVSVAQALSEPEVLDLATQAGVSYARLHRHSAHRFVLAGEKPA